MKSLVRFSILAVFTFAVAACQTKPTATQDNPNRRFDGQEASEPIQVTKETIVVDARPAFDYSTAHIPQSIPLTWSDFTEPEPTQRGIVQHDVFGVARRLARAGISPNTKVVVVGNGLRGQGEEGRMAWMLAYLGVTEVRFTNLDSLKARVTNLPENKPPVAQPIWKPQPDATLVSTKEEVRFVINERGVERAIVFSPGSGKPGVQGKATKTGDARIYRIIDVRSEAAYLGREGLGARTKVPNMDAINIPWKEFFTTEFRPKFSMAERLQQVGILKEHRVIVLDEDGIASGAVTMALRRMGYAQAANYAGGLQDLLNSPGK